MMMTMTMMTMKTEACAKVNFTLEVLGKRVDGYHALRSVVMPVSLADTLELEATDDGSVTSDTGYADDLCVKAARVLRARCPGAAGVRIRVEKRIPAGGGLGGGSADAAAVLRTLNRLWGCGLSLEALVALGSDVGSDVPALVLAQELNGPVLMEGRGEAVSPLFDKASADLPHSPFSILHSPLALVLVNPGVFCSTPEVFRRCTPRVTNEGTILYNMRTALASGDVLRIAAALTNDLEPPAVALHPEIGAARDALEAAGATGVLMSGSGSTVFGLVPTESRGREIAAVLEAQGFRAWSVRTACPVV